MNRRGFLTGLAVGALAMPAIANAQTAPAPRRILIAGQSLGVRWAQYPEAQEAFIASRSAMGDETATQFLFAAYGGASLLKELCSTTPVHVENYWVDSDPLTNRKISGPRTVEARDYIRSLPPTERPTDIFWIQGTTDALAWAARQPYGAEEFANRYVYGLRITLGVLQVACNPENSAAVRVHIQRHRDIPLIAHGGDQVLQSAQDTIVRIYGEDRNYRMGAIHSNDVPMEDRVHQSRLGAIVLANRFARAFDRPAGDVSGSA